MADPRATRELRILNAIAESLNSAPDVERALEQTLVSVTKLLGLHTGWVWLLDQASQQFYHAASRELPPYLQEPVRMTGRPCWCIEEFQAGRLTPKNINVLECSRLRPAVKARATDLTRGLAYHASIPLYFQDKPLGILNITGPAWRELTPEELRLLSTIAYQVGIAIERARLADEGARLARAEERARIAREIHDTLAQGLTAIGLQLEGALRHVDARPDRARPRMERALALVRKSLEDARRSVQNLRPAPLDGAPLAEALAALARAFTSETGVRVQLKTGGGGALPAEVENELFRIAEEALTNIRRHAQPTSVSITLGRTATHARLQIRDDGGGFDLNAVPEDAHGLRGMRERARTLGGTLRVESEKARGTTVSARVPLGDA